MNKQEALQKHNEQYGENMFSYAKAASFEEGWDKALEEFAKWLDDERNKQPAVLWSDTKIWGKQNAFQLMLQEFNHIDGKEQKKV